MTRIYAITNQKGGVGKTTTSINLAASLVATKRRVLLVDMDPQGHATLGSGVEKRTLTQSVFDLLMGEAKAEDIRVHTDPAGYDLLPSNLDLTAAEIGLLDMPQRERRLAQGLAPILSDYDYVLIDCPPSLSLLTLNGLTAAQSVLIPVQCEYYALEGLTALLDTLKRLADSVNPHLSIAGILRTMYDPRNSLTRDVSSQLIDYFDDRVLSTVIPRNVRLAEAPSYGLPALCYDGRSRGSLAYLALAGEMIRRAESGASTEVVESA
ncbi:chromosome partitioning protein [Terasakiispira papahanaumokuakeensis]|uniref:Chromosome partitioning protein n=1 Tax=Terasakiispira papahanaumokuakeensis TaxID=197479 RepID=A0A1E2VCV4_9GAMM|nr:ParA family protein [Terasakiispira papahanaumokuakeensis]ODC04783.1 chromosome partitioning protein [Terasakiispira papahanaumokuakeensis]